MQYSFLSAVKPLCSLDRTNFEYLEMDTDSAYIALSGESVEALVKPQLREEFTIGNDQQKQKDYLHRLKGK